MTSQTSLVQENSSLNRLPFVQAMLSHCLMPLLFLALVFSMIPIAMPFGFDNDEGINIMKALLYSKGFALYTQIWSDQPPLLTVALSHWFTFFGQTILAGRLLVLLFSVLLIWSFYQVLRQLTGNIPAFIGALLLIFSNRFLQLSASVMVGMPSLALAMSSIYAAVLYKKTNQRYFIPLSGLLLALSLQTKLFTIFLLPVIALYVIDFKLFDFQSLLHTSKDVLRSQLTVVGSWLLSLGFIYLCIGLIFNSINYEQLLQAHLGRTVAESFEKKDLLQSLDWLLRKDWDLVLLSGLGVVIVLLKRYWSGLFPLAWLAIALPLLLNHQPIWYHHFHLLSIPLAWLAAYGIVPIVDYVQQSWRSRLEKLDWKRLVLPVLTVSLLIYSSSCLDNKMGDIARNVHGLKAHTHPNPEIIQLLLQSKTSLNWIVTDRPIYAFQVGVPVPPETVVFSVKRLASGNLTHDSLLAVLKRYEPERIIWSRFKDYIEADADISNYIDRYYNSVYQSESAQMYALKI